MDFENLIQCFSASGEYVETKKIGRGHIHDTYAVKMLLPGNIMKRYILQKINRYVFRDVNALMDNINNITIFLQEKMKKTGSCAERETLQLILTKDGKSYYQDENAECWRLYLFIENTITLQKAESGEDFYQAGKIFGKFQKLLSDYDAQSLIEILPAFHNTPKRFVDFTRAVERDCKGRVKTVSTEIQFYKDREKQMNSFIELVEKKELPIRVTHNDTKLNNVLFDEKTRKAICLVDLDTVMPGVCHYDYGDAIRYGASSADEDETDLEKVSLDMNLFELFTKGFLEETREMLTPLEIELLPVGAKMMTMECGMRFLTDYLEGDAYFKISHPEHNLERARNQIKLASDIEYKWKEMNKVIKNYLT